MAPTHTPVAPAIAVGVLLTVTTLVVIQLVGNVYVMIVVPGTEPITIPVAALIPATTVVLLVHTPPDVALDKGVGDDIHMLAVPVMAAGSGLTVMTREEIQPNGNIYVIAAVPATKPETTPLVLIEAISGDPELQLPPGVKLDRAIVLPTHTVPEPAIVAGSAVTLSAAVVLQPVGSVYDIIVAPPVIPVTKPVVDTIVPTAATLLLHVPPTVLLANVAVAF